MLCQHGPGTKCINCLPPDTAVAGVEFEPFAAWKEAIVGEGSGKGTTLVETPIATGAGWPSCLASAAAMHLNVPTRTLSRVHTAVYRLRPGCGRHPPWPKGICLNCAPPPIDILSQPFRTVDYLEVRVDRKFLRRRLPFIQVYPEMRCDACSRGGF
jgi:hypothetical protein